MTPSPEPPYSSGIQTPMSPALAIASLISQGYSCAWSYFAARGRTTFSATSRARARHIRFRSVRIPGNVPSAARGVAGAPFARGFQRAGARCPIIPDPARVCHHKFRSGPAGRDMPRLRDVEAPGNGRPWLRNILAADARRRAYRAIGNTRTRLDPEIRTGEIRAVPGEILLAHIGLRLHDAAAQREPVDAAAENRAQELARDGHGGT